MYLKNCPLRYSLGGTEEFTIRLTNDKIRYGNSRKLLATNKKLQELRYILETSVLFYLRCDLNHATRRKKVI